MANPENIIPPKFGEIRNPKGRGKGVKNRSTILRKWIETKTKDGTFEDTIVLALLKKAGKGDVRAIQEAFDTLYGKNADKSEVKHEGDIIIELYDGTDSKE